MATYNAYSVCIASAVGEKAEVQLPLVVSGNAVKLQWHNEQAQWLTTHQKHMWVKRKESNRDRMVPEVKHGVTFL